MENLVFFTVLALVLSLYPTNSEFDLTEESGCHDTEFRLGCDSLTEKIAIFKAVFVPRNGTYLTFSPEKNLSSCEKRRIRSASGRGDRILCHDQTSNDSREIDFRQTINRRCSGLNYCSFVFQQDVDGTESMGPGHVTVRYACVPESPSEVYVTNKYVKRTCNVKVNVLEEGFARSPGYPSYYIGETTCRWTLEAPKSQRVKLTFLDLSLRSVGPHESGCFDRAVVTENGLDLVEICGDLTENTVVYSQGRSLNVTLVANSKTLYPKRGFLFHYKAVGCPSVRKPEDGYLIDRNDSFVHFRCCVGFVFADTLSRDKVLQCYNENTWNGHMTDCISLSKLLEEGIYLLSNVTSGTDLSAASSANMESTDSMKDVVLPSLIIAALFLGNAIVLYVIYRQRKKLTSSERIEMKSIGKGRSEEEKC